MLKNSQGLSLAMVIIVALTASVAAYAALIMATAAARRRATLERRVTARYLSEAGIVIAMSRLQRDPDYPGCSTPGSDVSTTEFIDINNDGIAASSEPSVSIQVANCGAGRPHTLKATSTF